MAASRSAMPSAVSSSPALATDFANVSISGHGCTFSSLTRSFNAALAPASASSGVSRAV
jgi:hypothetical protein